MIFLSRDRSPEYVIVPRNFEVHDTSAGKVSTISKGIKLKFSPLDEGLATNLLPMKMGEQVARGMLDTTVAAKQQGVEEAFLNEFLLDNERHGIEFVGVDSAGEEDDQQAEAAVVKMGDGYFCTLCDKTLKKKSGVASHIRSGDHVDAVNKVRASSRRDLAAAKASITPESPEALAHGSAAAG